MKIKKLSALHFIHLYGTIEQKEKAQKASFKMESGTKQLDICKEIVENNNLDEDIEIIFPSIPSNGITLLE